MNGKRVLAGALAGGVVWSVWSAIVNGVFLKSTYMAEARAGHLLPQARYGAVVFLVVWFVTLFLISGICAWLYAGMRATRGAGPGTALKIGFFVGFAAAFPISLIVASWDPVTRVVPLWWLLDLWVGAILATLVAGWIYKDKAPVPSL